MAILIEDTFDGTGLLSAHTGNSGVTWIHDTNGFALVLTGAGGVSHGGGGNAFGGGRASVPLPAAGAVDFFLKPADPQTLVRRLQHLCHPG